MAAWWFAVVAGVACKSTAVLVAAWILAFMLRRRSAAARHLVWTAAAAAVVALPFLSLWIPPLSVRTPAVLAENLMFRITALGAAAAPLRAGTWHPDWRVWIMLLWGAGLA